MTEGKSVVPQEHRPVMVTEAAPPLPPPPPVPPTDSVPATETDSPSPVGIDAASAAAMEVPPVPPPPPLACIEIINCEGRARLEREALRKVPSYCRRHYRICDFTTSKSEFKIGTGGGGGTDLQLVPFTA